MPSLRSLQSDDDYRQGLILQKQDHYDNLADMKAKRIEVKDQISAKYEEMNALQGRDLITAAARRSIFLEIQELKKERQEWNEAIEEERELLSKVKDELEGLFG